MLPGEPLWLDTDREAVLDYRANERAACPRCRTYEEEWGTFDEKGRLRPHPIPPYHAETRRCLACADMARVQKEVPEGELGVYVHLARTVPPGVGLPQAPPSIVFRSHTSGG